MKYVIAVVAQGRFDRLVDELAEHHAHSLLVSDVRGFELGHPAEQPQHVVKKLRAQIVCRDDEVAEVLAAVSRAAPPGTSRVALVVDVIEALGADGDEQGGAGS